MPVFATFNSISDGDPILASPIMQNFRHVNYGSVMKPVDSAGNDANDSLDLGTNTVKWQDLYLSGGASLFGSLGIGTLSPAADMEIEKPLIADSNDRLSLLLDTTGSWGSAGNINTTTDLSWVNGSTNLMGTIGLGYGGSFSYMEFKDMYATGYGDSGVIMRLQGNGNVGIGTASPAFGSGSGLEIESSGIATLRIQDSASSKSFEMFVDASVESAVVLSSLSSGMGLKLQTAGTNRMIITSSGDTSFLGGVDVSGNVTITGGNFTISSGNVTISSGDVTISSGNVTIAGGIDVGGNGVYLKTKVIDIGDWDMDTTFSVSISHGLTITNIRSVSVLITNDQETTLSGLLDYDGATSVAGQVSVGTTTVSLSRFNGSSYDDTSYDATSYNRGWIYITYVE